MVLHLGGDMVIPNKEIIAILKYDLNDFEISKEFFKISEEEGFINYICAPEKAKSYILTEKKIYVSPISTATLQKRGKDLSYLYDSISDG